MKGRHIAVVFASILCVLVIVAAGIAGLLNRPTAATPGTSATTGGSGTVPRTSLGVTSGTTPVVKDDAGAPFVSGRWLTDSTQELAQQDPKSSYDFVAQNNGEFVSLDAGNTYGVWWQPEDFDPKADTVVVSLGGHGGWATRDFSVWYPHISERGYGFLTIQWWLGRSLENEGYYEPEEIYAMIRQVLAEKGITPGNVIFQGYSMGSARSYGVTALDQVGGKYFALTIANSGVWEDDYPINADILAGKYGTNPFAGTRWILYCAVNDTEHPDWNKCAAMDETKTKIESLGGTVDLYIKDPEGTHGSFMVNAENARQALDVADSILAE